MVIGVRKSFAKITNRASLTRQSMIDREEIEQEVHYTKNTTNSYIKLDTVRNVGNFFIFFC